MSQQQSILLDEARMRQVFAQAVRSPAEIVRAAAAEIASEADLRIRELEARLAEAHQQLAEHVWEGARVDL